jgi:SAM-dependent methyltransferase
MSELVQSIIDYQGSRGGAHKAGTLTAAPLERIEWYFQNYFKGRPVRSAETGCGASTIVLSRYATHHTAYTYDDRADENSSVDFAVEYPGFNAAAVKWVFGPTQRTLFSDPLDQDIDIVLIDGPHGYPFPELEYFAFYRRLAPGGILILDDVHIPTINNLYKALLQDDSFYSHGLAATTAYFQRSDRPAFDMEGDGWYLQRYNVQRFPAIHHEDVSVGHHLPLKFAFDGVFEGAPLARGFSFQNGRPVTEGDLSIVEVKLAPSAPKRVRLALDIEPICVEDRLAQTPMVKICIAGQVVYNSEFTDSGRRTIEFEAETDESPTLRIEFWHSGLLRVNDLPNWRKSPWVWFDGRLLNFWLHSLSLSDAGAAEEEPNVVNRVAGQAFSFDYAGERITFFVDDPVDPVQRFHAAGQFADLAELDAVQRLTPAGARILDLGAGVGNHAAFFAKYADAARIALWEPDRRKHGVLRLNMALNAVAGADFSLLPQDATAAPSFPGLLANGAFQNQSFDLIRFEQPGAELDFIENAKALIGETKPLLMIHVGADNVRPFLKKADALGYIVAWQHQKSDRALTYILADKPSKPLRTKDKSSLLRPIDWFRSQSRSAAGEATESLVQRLDALEAENALLRKALSEAAGDNVASADAPKAH